MYACIHVHDLKKRNKNLRRNITPFLLFLGRCVGGMGDMVYSTRACGGAWETWYIVQGHVGGHGGTSRTVRVNTNRE